MSDDREQDQPEERESAARPVTAAARRERRASARPASRKDSAAPKSDEDSDEASKKGRPTRARDTPQEKRTSLIGKGFRYIREVVSELRKVIWPTRKQLITYTSVVLVFVAFMVALVWGLDLGFGWGVFELFG